MPISRQTLSETLSDDLASLHKARAALSNAWALRMSASLKAHFAQTYFDHHSQGASRSESAKVDRKELKLEPVLHGHEVIDLDLLR